MAARFDPYHKWLAIPPDEQPPNHYRLLAISLYESDPDVIANAADQRMAHLKSFQSGKHSAASQRILNEVAKAKLCLLNAGKRAEYDQDLRAELEPVDDEPVQVAEQIEITPVVHVETVSPSKRQQQKLQPWQIVAGAVSLVLVLIAVVAVPAILLSRGGPEKVSETKPRGKQDEPPTSPETKPEPPETKPKLPDTKPEPPETKPEPPEIKPEPPETKPEPPETKPEPPETKPEPEPFLSGEALTKAVDQFEQSLAEANKPADFKAAAQQGLTLLDHAIVDDNHELAKKTAAAALAAARSAEDGELSRKTTLRFLDVQQPLTESMKEEARKRLDSARKR